MRTRMQITFISIFLSVSTAFALENFKLQDIPLELLNTDALDLEMKPLYSNSACWPTPLTSPVPPEHFEPVQVEGNPFWLNCMDGVTKKGNEIPRKHLLNWSSSVNSTVKKYVEGYFEKWGEPVLINGKKKAVQGSGTWFGGSKDMGVTPTETGSLAPPGEKPLRQIGEGFTKLEKVGENPKAGPTYLHRTYFRRDVDYFAGLRADSKDSKNNNKKFWINRKIIVIDPETNRAVVVRVIDWGPHAKAVPAPKNLTKEEAKLERKKTKAQKEEEIKDLHLTNPEQGKIIDISPASFEGLGRDVKEGVIHKLYIAFVRDDMPLGPVDPSFCQ